MHITRRIFLTALTSTAASVAVLGAATRARAAQPWFYQADGAAIDGYDAVAYFAEGKPLKGERSFSVMWKGANWYFASAQNRDRFEMDPHAYAPQYGGYCAYAVSRGYTARIDPHAWRIVDEKLYLNYSRPVRALWARDIPGNILKANANWPDVLER
ncbi:YHS domain-containing (seleno)protein [Aestuariivita sp.]|jgi:YHS domain-containing protein|uniref:YHS domain-containing (seleno)protein n=1 Tax=Aestuariivita sp. TaxID=1872407 RepID=UPI0021707307|nr:YHS domain-containing (seleno)protein [Aestuariivita sp.]MCE8008097.1 YHS domain-containing protein [Aestuariivita sp.]